MCMCVRVYGSISRRDRYICFVCIGRERKRVTADDRWERDYGEL